MIVIYIIYYVIIEYHIYIHMHTPYIVHRTWGYFISFLKILAIYCLQNMIILFIILLFENFIHAYNVFRSYAPSSFLLLQFLLILPTKILSLGHVLCF